MQGGNFLHVSFQLEPDFPDYALKHSGIELLFAAKIIGDRRDILPGKPGDFPKGGPLGAFLAEDLNGCRQQAGAGAVSPAGCWSEKPFEIHEDNIKQVFKIVNLVFIFRGLIFPSPRAFLVGQVNHSSRSSSRESSVSMRSSGLPNDQQAWGRVGSAMNRWLSEIVNEHNSMKTSKRTVRAVAIGFVLVALNLTLQGATNPVAPVAPISLPGASETLETKPTLRTPKGNVPPELLEKYDANKDGQLDEVERAVLMRDLKDGKLQMPTRRLNRTNAVDVPPELLEKYDTNKDGKLDENERAALRRDMQVGKLQAPRGHAISAGQKSPAELLEKYDVNKDGKLDEAEQAQIRKDLQRGKPQPASSRQDAAKGQVPSVILEKYDTNKDGKLDEAERAAIKRDLDSGKLVRPLGAPGAPESPKPSPAPQK